MKWFLFAGIVFFVGLFAGTTFAPPSAEIEQNARKYFTPEEVERGQDFSFQRKLLFWTGTGLRLGLLAWIVCSGFGRTLATGCLVVARGRWIVAVLLVGGFCFLADEAIAIPIGLARLENLRAWGMTRRSIADWLLQHAVAVGVSGAIEISVLTGLYVLIRLFPRTWWLLATAGGMVLAVAFALILPIWISPLFNRFTPLEQTPWSNFTRPVTELAQRGGVQVHDILVMDASRQSSHTNAYFTGFGNTRRIVLYDNLLRAHTRWTPGQAAGMAALVGGGSALVPFQALAYREAYATQGWLEIESILAHEMGHWKHNHIVQGIVLGGAAVLVGFLLLSAILKAMVGRPPLRLTSPFDPAGVPLVGLLMLIGMWLAAPVENAVSRHFERQADQVSLEMTDRPAVFIETEKRMARDNISNVTPNRWSIWFLATHPPTVERIRMAEEWDKNSRSRQ